jgi:hypothetical protein
MSRFAKILRSVNLRVTFRVQSISGRPYKIALASSTAAALDSIKKEHTHGLQLGDPT